MNHMFLLKVILCYYNIIICNFMLIYSLTSFCVSDIDIFLKENVSQKNQLTQLAKYRVDSF